MAEERERFSLSRWSRRKLDARRAPSALEEAPALPAPTPAEAPPEPVAPLAVAAVDTDPVAPAQIDDAAPLPPVDSLSIDSDFRPFMRPKVDEATKRAALRKLFSDPHFNVMDGLDVYIDDYGKPDPMPEGMLAKIVGVYDRLAEESAARDAEEAAARASAAAAADGASGDAHVPALDADASQPPPDGTLAAHEEADPSSADDIALAPPSPHAPPA